LPSLLVLLPLLAVQSQQLTATELSLGVASAMARETFIGGELGLARRTSNESRAALAIGRGAARVRRQRAQLTLQPPRESGGTHGVRLYEGSAGRSAVGADRQDGGSSPSSWGSRRSGRRSAVREWDAGGVSRRRGMAGTLVPELVAAGRRGGGPRRRLETQRAPVSRAPPCETASVRRLAPTG
jgi:hypothetical protein